MIIPRVCKAILESESREYDKMQDLASAEQIWDAIG